MSRPAPTATRRRVAAGLAALAGLTALGWGAGTVAHEARVGARYGELSKEAGHTASPQDSAGNAAPRRDWAALGEQFPAVGAWATVGGTPIDLPIASTSTEEDEGWFLRHDLWGEWSLSGTPFMDRRVSNADDRNVVAYGHHMTSTDTMFSTLQRAYEQDVFDGLGVLLWETPARDTKMSPLCAVSVDETWPDIQRFDWQGAGDAAFREWLGGILSASTAAAPDARNLVAAATRCVALVTCSSDWAYQNWRTVCVWCA